ncbi:CHC2 zinc finger domain-containing protein [Dethiosulfatibacter aminovorans]|uniref:CHC2 zinc finger domain-containing protein n=1 Tax=Dethiosulfatibacter aminovorans TaxID=332095 RepID=UPI0015871A5B|nr:CHC2 zinc finger domain-containing protein [Dethiosulfatibacter aminovorans]
MINTKQFLESFHGKEKINFNCIKQYGKKLNSEYNDKTIDVLSQLNEQGYNIYFYVNGGGVKDKEINKFNALFIDFDKGKIQSKEYYPLDEVAKYKEECIKKVQDFDFEPSFIVETRNGIHVYWLLNEGALPEEWKICTEKLISYFDSDPRVKNPARLMRVPNYNWIKDINNPFMCNIIESNNIKYDIEDFMFCLPDIEKKEIKKSNRIIKTVKKVDSNNNDNMNIMAIKNLDVDMMKLLLDRGGKRCNDIIYTIYKEYIVTPKTHDKDIPTDTLVLSDMEFFDLIEYIDLYIFLGVDGDKFSCILPSHEDNNPSAGIVTNQNDHYMYNCFGCGFKGGILKLIQAISGCNLPQSINFLKAVFNITTETEYQKQQKELYDSNISYILSGKMENDYPDLWKYIKPRKTKLITLLEYAKNNITDEKYSIDGDSIFYGSIRYFKDLLNIGSLETINKTIQLFNFLELVTKIAPEEIPSEMLEKHKKKAKENKHKNLINTYMIKSYDYNTLQESDEKAKILKDNNFSMKGLSYEYILRTFGEETAKKYYPQNRKSKPSKKSDILTNEIVKIIFCQIELKGFVIEKEIVESLGSQYGREKVKTQMKRSIQEILDKYDLQRIRANKLNKEKYGITCQGYPFIIVRGD